MSDWTRPHDVRDLKVDDLVGYDEKAGGNLTSGPWLLTVRNNRGGVALCPFEVVP